MVNSSSPNPFSQWCFGGTCKLFTWIMFTVILLPAHSASFGHNFVIGMQSFYFSESPGCNSIADLSLKKCSGS